MTATLGEGWSDKDIPMVIAMAHAIAVDEEWLLVGQNFLKAFLPILVYYLLPSSHFLFEVE